jgi:hypothetical protein
MDKGLLPLLELLLIVGVVFGFWQLAALKRGEQQQKGESAKQPSLPASPPVSPIRRKTL